MRRRFGPQSPSFIHCDDKCGMMMGFEQSKPEEMVKGEVDRGLLCPKKIYIYLVRYLLRKNINTNDL